MPSFRPSSSMPPVPSSLSPGVSDFLTTIQSSGSESSSAPLGNLFEATYLPTPPLPLPDSVLYPPPAYPPPAYPPPVGFPFGPQVPPTGRFPPPPNSPFAQPFFEGANSHYPCEPHTGLDRWHPSRNGRSTFYGSEKPSSSRSPFWLGPQADNSNHSSSGHENGSLLAPLWPGTQGDNNANHSGSEFRFAKSEPNFPSVAPYPPPYTLLGSNFPPLRDLSAIANAPIVPSSASPSITAPLAAPSHFSSFSSPNLPLDFPLSGPRFSFGSHGSAFVPGLDPAPAFCAGGAEYIPEPVPSYLSRTFQAPDHFHDASSCPIFSPETAANRPLTGGSQFSFLDSHDTTSFPGPSPFFSIPPAFPPCSNNAPSALGPAVTEQPSGPAPLIESTCEFLSPLFSSGSSAPAGNQAYLRNAGCPSTTPEDEEKMERIVKDDAGEHWFQHLSPEERRWKSYEPRYDAASFEQIRSSEYNLFHGLDNSGRRDGLWFDGGISLDLLANPSGRGFVEKERSKAERHACPHLNGAASAVEIPPLVSTGATSVLEMPGIVPIGATSTTNQSLLSQLASTSGDASTSGALGASGGGQGGRDRLLGDCFSSSEPGVVYKQNNYSSLNQKIAESVCDHPSTSCSNSYKHDDICQLEDAFCDLEGAPGPWALPTLTFEEAASVVGSSPSKGAVSAGLSVSIPHHEVSSSRLESQLPVDSSCNKSSAYDSSQAYEVPQATFSAQTTGIPLRTVTHGKSSRPDTSSQGDARFDGSGLHSLAASISNLSKVMLLLDTSSLGLPDTSNLEGSLQGSILRLTECLLLEQSRINRTVDATSLAGSALASRERKVADIARARNSGGSTNLDYRKASEIGRSTTSTSAGVDTGGNVHYPCSSHVAGVSKNPVVDTEKAQKYSQRMKEFHPPQFPDAALEDVLSCLYQNGLRNRASLEKLIGAEERESELKVIVQELREELKFEREEDRGARALSVILKQEAEISKAKEMPIAVKAEVGLKTASMRFALDSSESSEEGSTPSASMSKLEQSSEMGPSRDACHHVQYTGGRLGSPDEKPDRKSHEGGQCSESGAILNTLADGWDEYASKTQDTCRRNDQVLSRLAILQARNQDTVNEMEVDLKSSFENLEKDLLQLQPGSGEAQPSVPSVEACNQAAVDDMQTRLKYLFPNWDENQVESQLGFVQAKPAASTLEASSQALIDGIQMLQKTSYPNWEENQAESQLGFVHAHPAVDTPHDDCRDTEQRESQAINLNLQLASGHQDTTSAVDQVEQRLGLLQARTGQQVVEAVTSEFLENELYPPPQQTQVDIDSSKSCSEAVEALADLIRCRPDWIEDSSQIQMDFHGAQSGSLSSQISTGSGTSNSESGVEGAQNQLDTDDDSSWEHVRLPK